MTENTLARRRNLSPLSTFVPFFNALDQAFEPRFFSPVTSFDQGFYPAVDVVETDEVYTFTAELPAVRREDVEITLENQILTINGERKLENTEGATFHRNERRYGRFSRSFTLPKACAGDGIKAAMQDGILSVTVPKATDARPQRIQIN